MLKLPCGHHDGVRFDIDYSPNPSSLASYSQFLGTGLGYPNSFLACNCGPGSTLCLQGIPGQFGALGASGAAWYSYGYSSSNWSIPGLNATGTSGYLFAYLNTLSCGSGQDQGPAQFFITSTASQLNALNDPNLRVSGSTSSPSQMIVSLQNSTGQTPSDLMPPSTFNFDESIYYIEPTTINFTTSGAQFPYLAIGNGLPVGAILFSILTNNNLISSLSLINYNTSDEINCTTSVTNGVVNITVLNPQTTGITSFAFSATQPFYQSLTDKISFLETQIFTTVIITTS